MSNKLLSVENLTMKFGGLIAIDNLSFSAQRKSDYFNHWTQWSWKNNCF